MPFFPKGILPECLFFQKALSQNAFCQRHFLVVPFFKRHCEKLPCFLKGMSSKRPALQKSRRFQFPGHNICAYISYHLSRQRARNTLCRSRLPAPQCWHAILFRLPATRFCFVCQRAICRLDKGCLNCAGVHANCFHLGCARPRMRSQQAVAQKDLRAHERVRWRTRNGTGVRKCIHVLCMFTQSAPLMAHTSQG